MQSKRALFAGDAVMAKLVAISKQFCFRNSDASSGTELLEAVSKVVSKMGCSDLLVRLRRNEELFAEDIRQLNGDAYETVVEAGGEERSWRDHMHSVRKNGSLQIFWVTKHVSETSNGYDIVQVFYSAVH